MIKVRNISQKPQHFATPAGTVEVLAGETRTVDVLADDACVKAKAEARQILVGEPDAGAEAAAPVGKGAIAPEAAGEDQAKVENKRARRGSAGEGEQAPAA